MVFELKVSLEYICALSNTIPSIKRDKAWIRLVVYFKPYVSKLSLSKPVHDGRPSVRRVTAALPKEGLNTSNLLT
jgi:hypothetical protein